MYHGEGLDEWEDAPYSPPRIFPKCNCGGKGRGVHQTWCAWLRAMVAKDGHVPPQVRVDNGPQEEPNRFTTKESEVSTLKFSLVDTNAKAQRLSVREVTRISTAIRVVGLQYARSLPLVKDFAVGQELCVTMEPTNPHDCHAVKVMHGDTHIGYIEKAEARAVCDVLSSLGDSAVKAVVSRIDTRSDLYNMLWVVIEATYYVRA